LLYHAATTTTTGSSVGAISSRSAASANDQRLYCKQFPRIGNAAKRPLYGRSNFSS
jgi:hypothetical protein